jgi:hypothetical protein
MFIKTLDQRVLKLGYLVFFTADLPYEFGQDTTS